MKLLGIVFASLLMMSFTGWETDFEKAKQTAVQEHKYILLNFSGSDWCGPCIRMHRDILETDAFQRFAKERLVMVNADFPRQKKNQLSKSQQKQNEMLADKYNSKGSFPFTAILDEKGNVLKSWDGYPKGSPEDFLQEVRDLMNN